MSITSIFNSVMHGFGLHLAKQHRADRIPWILKTIDSSISPLSWMMPELIRRNGLETFVQIGANDGKQGDPFGDSIRSHTLKGILVEPQPDPCAALRKLYGDLKGVVIEQLAIDQQEGHIILYQFPVKKVKTYGGEVNPDIFTSGDLAHMKKMAASLGIKDPLEEMKVPALTWDQLLRKHSLPNPDIVIVDTEGMDDVIINQINLNQCAPAVIQFEHIHLNTARLQACANRLASARYRFVLSEYDLLCLHPRVYN